jgi:hypothetical protein
LSLQLANDRPAKEVRHVPTTFAENYNIGPAVSAMESAVQIAAAMNDSLRGPV